MSNAVSITEVPHRSRGRRLISLALNVLLLGCVLAFAGLAVGPHVFGYRTATMLTGSMEPRIAPGDVVVTVQKPAADLKVGDVISYRIPIEDHRVETHRVTEVHRTANGATTFRTKGDNNANGDPWTATTDEDIVWVSQAVIPNLGTAIRVLRSPAIQHGVFWVSFGGLLLLGLTLIWGSPVPKPENDPDQDRRVLAA